MFGAVVMGASMTGVVVVWLNIRSAFCPTFSNDSLSNREESNPILNAWNCRKISRVDGQITIELGNMNLTVGRLRSLIGLAKSIPKEERPTCVKLRKLTLLYEYEYEVNAVMNQLFAFLQCIPLQKLVFYNNPPEVFAQHFALEQSSSTTLRQAFSQLPDLAEIEFQGSLLLDPPTSHTEIGTILQAFFQKDLSRPAVLSTRSYSLVFSHGRLAQETVKDIKAALKECNYRIRKLGFRSCLQSSEVRNAVFDLLRSFPTESSILKTIDLSGNGIHSNDISFVSKILEAHSQMEHLYLQGNEDLFANNSHLSDDFCSALENLKHLRVLDISDCGVANGSAFRILEALQHSSLKSLNLDHNPLTDGLWFWQLPRFRSLETLCVPVSLESAPASHSLRKALSRSTSICQLARRGGDTGLMEPAGIGRILARNRLLARVRSLDDKNAEGVKKQCPISLWPSLLSKLGGVSDSTPMFAFLSANHIQIKS